MGKKQTPHCKTRQSCTRRRKRVRGGADPGTRIRIIYAPGAATSMEQYITIEPNEATPGWGTYLKNMDNSFANFIQGMVLTLDETQEKLKKTSTYSINAIEKPEVVDIQQKREHQICEDETVKKSKPTEQPKGVVQEEEEEFSNPNR